MTAPTQTAVTGKCGTCGGKILYLGGPSWRHIRRPGGHPHPADPDQATRNQMREAA